MAADLRKFDEKAITILQANVRGAFVRSKLNEVRHEFENIVYELDGPSYRVLWNPNSLSFPLVTNSSENHEKIIPFASQITNKSEETETTEDEDEEYKTITPENCEKIDVCGDTLTHVSTESVRQNLEGKFEMAHFKDVGPTDKEISSQIDADISSDDLNNSVTAKDFGMPKVNTNVKDSGSINGHAVKDPGYANVSGSNNNDVKTGDAENHFESTKNNEKQSTSTKTKDSGHSIAKDLGYLHAKDSGCSNTKDYGNSSAKDLGYVHAKDSGCSNTKDYGNSFAKDLGYVQAKDSGYSNTKDSGSNTSVILTSHDLNSQSGLTSPVSINSDVFSQHSTPMPTQSTGINNRELVRHPLLTDSWMTDKSFDPVRSDDASSISDMSVSDLQYRREQVSMELLWTQQAIESRTNYLRLKKKMEEKPDLEEQN